MRKRQQTEVTAQLSNALAKAQSALEVQCSLAFHSHRVRFGQDLTAGMGGGGGVGAWIKSPAFWLKAQSALEI